MTHGKSPSGRTAYSGHIPKKQPSEEQCSRPDYPTSDLMSTTDHAEIRGWAEARDGRPAMVTGISTTPAGLLKVVFPGENYTGKGSLEKITWEDFFARIDENSLAFQFQEKKKKEGGDSRFYRFVARD